MGRSLFHKSVVTVICVGSHVSSSREIKKCDRTYFTHHGTISTYVHTKYVHREHVYTYHFRDDDLSQKNEK